MREIDGWIGRSADGHIALRAALVLARAWLKDFRHSIQDEEDRVSFEAAMDMIDDAISGKV
jgi:hypothetical protein